MARTVGDGFTPFRALLPAVFAVLLAAGCTSPLPRDVERHPSYAFSDPAASEIGRILAPATGDHPGQSGLLLLDLSEDSLLWRGALIDRSQRSIDAQYYIWEQDNIGTLAAASLLGAAERGVRVRVLVDDFPQQDGFRHLAFLDAHPNVEIRLYNPFPTRSSSALARALDVLGDFSRLNRRMHNKVMIVDGAAAIVGGRNVADPYYDMHEAFNFRDRDILAVGPIVSDVAASFDAFWNSDWSYPVDLFADSPQADATEAREAFYRWLLDYPRDPEIVPQRYREKLAATVDDLAELPARLIWAEAEILYDQPGKNDDLQRIDAFGRSGEKLTEIALAAKNEIVGETPYLIFLPGTFDVVEELIARGVRLRVLTNSLATTDLVLAFNAYAGQRAKMLELGVELFELKPDAALRGTLIRRFDRLDPDSSVTLHAKTAVFDRDYVYIGTFNMDPRSTHLNTEIGLLIRSHELAGQVLAALAEDMRPENAWQLRLDDDGEILWSDSESGGFVRHSGAPKAGFWLSFKSFLISFLSFESII